MLKVSCGFHSFSVPGFACAVKTRLGLWNLQVLSKWIWSLSDLKICFSCCWEVFVSLGSYSMFSHFFKEFFCGFRAYAAFFE